VYRLFFLQSVLPSFPWAFFSRCSFSNRYHCSLLKCARPKRLPDKFSVNPGVQTSTVSVLCRSNGGGETIQSGWCSHISGSFYANIASRFFFRFGGGRPLHNVQSLIFRNSTVDLAIRFAISRPVVFLKVSITFPVLSNRRSFRSRFLIPLLHCCCARRLIPSVRP
jgi:hypothetical protein